MASLTGPVYVPAPNPVVPRYGLFRVATGPLDLPMHARIGGLQYEIAVCDLPNCYEVQCQDDLQEKDITNGPTIQEGLPFVVYSAINCSPVGLANWGEERVRGWLFDQLRAGEQATVERTFSLSGCGMSPGLTGGPGVVTLPPTTDVTRGIAALEGWLYSRYGLPGVIHVPASAASFVCNWLLTKDPRGIWRTNMETAVSFGDYAGIGPTGQAPTDTTTWLYITGQIAIWRTPDNELFKPPMGQIINRSTNVMTIIMEREYVVSYDCYVAAVEVTLDVEADP